ncbi:MAG: protein-S-isoprenylcysteine O-methyltransferase Ste14 [Cyclobacteriaceae bacterium]|jgi:protein-S-isoprenylcysteine O-methyltransferase Ste14
MALRDEMRSNGDILFKYRSYLPIIILLVGLIIFIQSKLNYEQAEWNEYDNIGCVIVSIIGLLVRVITIGYSSNNTSGRNTSVGQIAESINTTGIYALCRHPLYLGNFLMWLGIAMFTMNFWFIMAFILLFYLYYERIMYAEESFLIETFGSYYLDYSQHIPAFIPDFSHWLPPANKFSWIKVIRQEKAGILNLSIVVFIFKSIEGYILFGIWYKLNSYWFWLLIFSLVWYLIIKIIQKNTTLLAYDR